MTEASAFRLYVAFNPLCSAYSTWILLTHIVKNSLVLSLRLMCRMCSSSHKCVYTQHSTAQWVCMLSLSPSTSLLLLLFVYCCVEHFIPFGFNSSTQCIHAYSYVSGYIHMTNKTARVSYMPVCSNKWLNDTHSLVHALSLSLSRYDTTNTHMYTMPPMRFVHSCYI